MSLRTFHIFFITLSTLLAGGFGVYAVFLSPEETQLLFSLGIISLISGVALILYGIWFYRKSKSIII